MGDDAERGKAGGSGSLVEKLTGAAAAGRFRDLGITPLARQLGLTPEQTNGHWCSRCEGIWWGYTLEAQCPVCGNRRG